MAEITPEIKKAALIRFEQLARRYSCPAVANALYESIEAVAPLLTAPLEERVRFLETCAAQGEIEAESFARLAERAELAEARVKALEAALRGLGFPQAGRDVHPGRPLKELGWVTAEAVNAANAALTPEPKP